MVNVIAIIARAGSKGLKRKVLDHQIEGSAPARVGQIVKMSIWEKHGDSVRFETGAKPRSEHCEIGRNHRRRRRRNRIRGRRVRAKFGGQQVYGWWDSFALEQGSGAARKANARAKRYAERPQPRACKVSPTAGAPHFGNSTPR